MMEQWFSPALTFCLGILRHPSQIRQRLRELQEISSGPSPSERSSIDNLPVVELVEVTAGNSECLTLVAIYARNRSPFFSGPATIKALDQEFAKGVEYYLVINNENEVVGARGFIAASSQCVQSVIDSDWRRQGYQLSALRAFAFRKAQEGYTEFRGVVMTGNKRQQRAMLSVGWEFEPHPDHANLLKGRLLLSRFRRDGSGDTC